MIAFDSIKFDLALADAELASFKAWLALKTFVGEKAIVGEIANRRHMACLLASTLGIEAPDLIKF